MYITRVEINGFMSFNDFELRLQKQLNIILGTNGTGKTNILRILHNALKPENHQRLCDFINDDNNDKFIRITINFDDQEITLLNNLYILLFLKRYIHNYNFINQDKFDELKQIIREIKEFNDGITLYFKYEKNIINRKLYLNKIKCYPEQCQCRLLDDNLIFHNSNCKNDSCVYKKINKINNNIHNNYYEKENNRVELYNNIIHVLNEIGIFNISYKNKDIFDLLNLNQGKIYVTYNDISMDDKFDLETIIINYINLLTNTISIDEYINIETLLKNIFQISQRFKIYNENTTKYIRNSIADIDFEHERRHDLSVIKNTNENLYKNIIEKFKEITNKEFNIKTIENNTFINDYEYVIISNNKQYECSNGEYELINFLSEYYSQDSTLMLLDEPCARLSHQNKFNFRKSILSKLEGKQIIMVTHDRELIDEETCKNILYFKILNDKTLHTTLIDENNINDTNNINGQDIKLLVESPEILFSEKCLLVEGYTDYIVMSQILKVFNIYNYAIIQTRGCGSKLYKILDKLKIEYKCLYDLDKLVGSSKSIFINQECINFIKNRTNDKILIEKIDNLPSNYKDLSDEILQDKFITLDIIKRILDSFKGEYFYIYVFFYFIDSKYLTTLSSENNLNDIDIKFKNGKNKLNKRTMEKLSILNNEHNIIINYIEFRRMYELIYNELLNNNDHNGIIYNVNNEEYINNVEHFKRDHLPNKFIDFVLSKFNIGFEYKLGMNLDQLIDEIIKQKKYFIFDTSVKDLEGLGRIIFNEKFKKSKWASLATEEIREAINKNRTNEIIRKIELFLKDIILFK